MADLVVVNPNVASRAVPVKNVSSASDRFKVDPGNKYLLKIVNGAGAPSSTVLDDPVSGVGALGATTPMNPDVTITTPATSESARIIEAARFADANGWVNITTSPITTLTIEVYGPLQT